MLCLCQSKLKKGTWALDTGAKLSEQLRANRTRGTLPRNLWEALQSNLDEDYEVYLIGVELEALIVATVNAERVADDLAEGVCDAWGTRMAKF